MRSRSASWSRRSSDASASSEVVQPTNGVSAAAETNPPTPGRASAESRTSQSRADGVAVDAREHGDVARLDGPPAAVVGDLLLVQGPQHLRGDVGVHELAHLPDGRGSVAGDAQRRARHLPQPDRGAAAQPAPGPGRLDRVDDDAGVAERRARQDRRETLEHGGVGAPVAVQGLRGRVGAGAQVGGDVGAAEPVDRLLRVADEHECAVSVERGAQDVPLHGVGVLELVDHDDPVPGADALRGGGAGGRVGERVAQQDQEVVVVEHPQRPLAPEQLAAGGRGQAVGVARAGVGRVRRFQPRGCVADRLVRDGAGVLHRQRRLLARRVLAQVEVVDHLGLERRDVRDQARVGLDVAQRAQRREHLLAEAVRRRDGGGVELRERLGQAPGPPGAVGAGQQRDDRVGQVVVRVPQGPFDGDEALADPFAQLGRGQAAERHEHELGQAGDALGDVPDGQRRDGRGLARPRARLEHHGALGQRAAHVERHVSPPPRARRGPPRAPSTARRTGCSRRPSPARQATGRT